MLVLEGVYCWSGFLLGPRSYGGGCDDPAFFGCWAGCLSVCVFVLQMTSRCVQLISDWEHLGPVL